MQRIGLLHRIPTLTDGQVLNLFRQLNTPPGLIWALVRSELFRSGSTPESFSVEQQGLFWGMTYRRQTICADPYEVWIVLRKMISGLDDKEIWARLSSVRQVQTPSRFKPEWGIGLLLVVLILALFLFGGSIF